MAEQLGPVEIDCDAPPYAIVKACVGLGLDKPEDVRWCRVRHFPTPGAGWRRVLSGLGWSEGGTCPCGQALPKMAGFVFTSITGEERFYLLGQCGKCHTVYWD
jgi:hypothetical protein